MRFGTLGHSSQSSGGTSYTPITATGGTTADITVGGRAYRVHTFTTSGDFVVSATGTNPEECEYFIVPSGGAAGGGAATNGLGGGGSAGEIKTGTFTVSVTTYPAVVGAAALGGASANDATGIGSDGNTSSIFGVSSIGGKGGGGGDSTSVDGKAGRNGSGGGRKSIVGGTGGTGTQFNGGNAAYAGSSSASGGGAGEGGAGGNGSSDAGGTPGTKGAGESWDFFGSAITFCEGGAGAVVATNPAARAANRGHGGNGAGTGFAGGNSSAGIIGVRYPLEAAA